jgi:hypothetical protein
MRKIQRAALVAAAVAGLSTLGAGVSFAGGNDGVPVTAVANSSANAVAVGGGYYVQPEAKQEEEQAKPEEPRNAEPEKAEGQHAPEQAYGQHEGDEDE